MSIKKESGDKREFETGAKRQPSAGKGTPVLIPADAYIDLAKHFEEGAIIHGDRNWEKGMPLSEYINSMERHIAAEKMGDTEECHDRALLWNAICYLATKLRTQRGILPKSLDDMPRYPRHSSGITVEEAYNTRVCSNMGKDSADVVEQAKAECGVRTCNCAPREMCDVCVAQTDAFYDVQAEKTEAKPTKRIYMSHSIRGRKGVEATTEDMERNNQLAIEAGEKLRKLMPDYNVYVPGSHDELVIIGFQKGYLDEQKILDIDCEIISKCDMVVAYTPDGYLSRGMTTELRHAGTTDTVYRRFFSGGNRIYRMGEFRDCYPEEYKKLL